MSLSEDETGVKLIIIIYYYDDLTFIELNCHLNWSDELEVRKCLFGGIFAKIDISASGPIQGYTNLFRANTNLLLQSTNLFPSY